MQTSLSTQNLTLLAGKRVLINDLNWRIQCGECWFVFGRNGVGKSTLLRTLAGVVPPSFGEVLIDEVSLKKWPLLELARRRSYLPQGHSDPFSYRVIDVVLSARHPYHGRNYWESERDQAFAEAALQQLDIIDLAHRNVRSLSGGERQRVSLATQLAQDATFMVLDEPTSALDLSHQIAAMELLRERCLMHSRAVVMVSHDLNIISRYATHVLIMMPDASWRTGSVTEMLTEDSLSQCLQHPIEIFQHQQQAFFMASAPSAAK